jgi:hypothetical protein
MPRPALIQHAIVSWGFFSPADLLFALINWEIAQELTKPIVGPIE